MLYVKGNVQDTEMLHVKGDVQGTEMFHIKEGCARDRNITH